MKILRWLIPQGGFYSSLETQEMMVEALGPEFPYEKVCKIPSVEGHILLPNGGTLEETRL
jgi:hypothetical protein